MGKVAIVAAAVLGLGVCLAQHPQTADVQAPEARREVDAMGDYRSALRALRSRLSDVKGGFTHVVKTRPPSGEESARVTTGRFARSSGRAEVVTSWYPEGTIGNASGADPRLNSTGSAHGTRIAPARETVHCYAPGRAFLLERDSRESPFRIKYVGIDTPDHRKRVDRTLARLSDWGVAAGGIPILELISSRHFVLGKAAAEAGPDGKRQLRVSFTTRPPEGAAQPKAAGRRRFVLRSGWILVSPDQRFALHEYAFLSHAGSGPSVLDTGTVSYSDQDVDGVPTPRSVETKMISCETTEPDIRRPAEVNGRIFEEESFELDGWAFGPVSPQQFSLEAFGLASYDPTIRPSSVWRIGLVCLLVASSGLIGSMGLRRLGSRGGRTARRS
jgi:hypothetical protein